MNGSITINGLRTPVEFGGTATLLDVLRAAGHTEVKRGCSSGECGSCIVLLDDVLVNSCQVFAATALDRSVTTTAGIAEGKPHPIHEAFVDAGAVQCGFCTPGMVMATHALLREHPQPTEDQIRAGLTGNICRCTGYVKIVDAVKLAAERISENG